jgi:hypothetical protein
MNVVGSIPILVSAEKIGTHASEAYFSNSSKLFIQCAGSFTNIISCSSLQNILSNVRNGSAQVSLQRFGSMKYEEPSLDIK